MTYWKEHLHVSPALYELIMFSLYLHHIHGGNTYCEVRNPLQHAPKLHLGFHIDELHSFIVYINDVTRTSRHTKPPVPVFLWLLITKNFKMPKLLSFCEGSPHVTNRFPSIIANCDVRVDSRLAPSQWDMLLQSNTTSHWLGTKLESALWCHHANCPLISPLLDMIIQHLIQTYP